ncbi:MAG: hypothetical protein KJO07_17030, partial [Deltaproteobacteria bacterium]|nr:hypothetical protein [Deltaproteobacteria bacterium]
RWLWTAGSKRAGYRWLQAYIERGGRDGASVRLYAEAVGWWRGLDAEVPAMVQTALAEAGATLCGTARDACPDVVRAVDDPGLARRLWHRTDGLARTRSPIEAAGWVSVGLRVWRDGGRGWLHNLAQRVDIDAIASAGELPLFAAPTLLRAAGQKQRARAALELAVEGAAILTAGQRQVVAHELAVRGDPRAVGLGYRIASPTDAAVDVRRLNQYWSRLPRGQDGAWPLHATRALESAGWNQELVAIAARHAVEPAASERLARDYAGSAVLSTARLLEVAELYRGLGDPARCRRWAERAAELAPRDADAVLAYGLCAHASGDGPAAEILITRAAGLSGDAGAVYARAAAELLGRGDPLAALQAGKRGLGLLPRGRQRVLVDVLIEANRRLDRQRQVAELKAALPATAEVKDDSTDREGDGVASWWRVATWNPMAAKPRALLLAAGEGAEQLPLELAVILVVGPADQARVAAEALGRFFEGRGMDEAVRVVERIGRGI